MDLIKSTDVKRVLDIATGSGNSVGSIREMFSDTDNKEQLAHIMLHHWWAKIYHQLDIPHYKTFSREHILKILEGLPFSDIEYSIEDNMNFEVGSE